MKTTETPSKENSSDSSNGTKLSITQGSLDNFLTSDPSDSRNSKSSPSCNNGTKLSITQGSLDDSLTSDPSDSPSDSDAVDSTPKSPLILNPPLPDSGPCKIKLLSAAKKIWERRVHFASHPPKPKKPKTSKSSSSFPASAFGAPPVDIPPSRKRGLVDEGEVIPAFHPKEASSFDQPFVPAWGVRTSDSVFGDDKISVDWFQSSPTPFDQSQLMAISDESIFSKGLQSASMTHCYIAEAFRRMKAYGPKITELKDELSMKDGRLQDVQGQLQELQGRFQELQIENETLTNNALSWKTQYHDAKEEAANAVNIWRTSAAWKEEQEKYMEDHGDDLYLGGWQQCSDHVLSLYPDIDPISIMEPQEKAKYLRRKKKVEALGISLEELPTDDQALEYASGDDDEDDGDEPDLDMAMTVQPEALAAELPPSPPS